MPKVSLTPREADLNRLTDNIKLIQGGRGGREMAQILGISVTTYCRKLKNPETFTYKEIKRLCDYTKVDIAAFVGSRLKIQ